MKKINLNWSLSHTPSLAETPKDRIPAEVPGAVQLDYAKALDYKPYYYGLNFRQFDWMEDEYFIYETTLDFTKSDSECATLCFMGIDYKYEIIIDGKTAVNGEGMFTPVKLDISQYSGKKVALKVILDPIPKCVPSPRTRVQARCCCKPASSYEWDWHPRLVPSGIWKEAYIKISPADAPESLEASYRLTDDLKQVTVSCSVNTYVPSELTASLIAPDGNTVCSENVTTDKYGKADFSLTLDNPELWYPRGYGDQPIYTLRVEGSDVVERKLGFRRSKLVENTGAKIFEKSFPKGPIAAPMTLEINGRRIFAKGSNWVNTEIFPCMMTDERYDELIQLACDANMNIFRLWGGQFINHEHFYDKCDEMGIMVWQEFMLSCNPHPDNDNYLAVLKQEATTIIKRLRTHPCLAFWCGGNELFNSWSGLTVQSHPLRLLDSLCYEHDRFTPFNMTSPLHGVSHGSYVKVQFPDDDVKKGIFTNGEEFICALKRTRSTAYTEFGCNGSSPKDYILKYIMDEKDYSDCNENNEIWVQHHAFKAWQPTSWMGVPEIDHFFGSHSDTDDIIDKSIYLQDLCYKTMFEEMRRQAPLCSMAVNWDFNEPWPCAAGNSLVNWPAEPKSCYYTVKEALRPTLFSLCTPRNRYLTGDVMDGCVWMLNDSDKPMPACDAKVYLVANGEKTLIATVSTPETKVRSNSEGGSFKFEIKADIPERFALSIESESTPEINSVYNFVHNTVFSGSGETAAVESNDFENF